VVAEPTFMRWAVHRASSGVRKVTSRITRGGECQLRVVRIPLSLGGFHAAPFLLGRFDAVPIPLWRFQLSFSLPKIY
jgi:hypothetical protein